jgi:CubicO group peptidase (beta-lactamase class C family)
MLNPVTLRSSLGALALVTVAASTAAAQSGRTLAQRLDSLAGSGVLENRAVGIVAAVVKGNDTLLLKAYGKADVEWDIPMPVDAMFELGSVAKQFTAVALLQLRDQGKLSFDDEITKWLPDFDTRGNTVTLRRLLDHTSGIVGLTEMPEFGNLVMNARFPRDSAYALIKRYPFQFKTGEAQIYNNSAFWLLGLVIEKASGMSYEDYVEKKIFEPLGMKRSMYCNSSEHVPRRAHGYGVRNGVVRRAPMNVHTWPFSAGSLCSTAGDMVTWVKALHGGKVLSPKSYAELMTPSKLNDGTPLRYSMGLQVGPDVSGLKYIGHGGSIAGFTAEVGLVSRCADGGGRPDEHHRQSRSGGCGERARPRGASVDASDAAEIHRRPRPTRRQVRGPGARPRHGHRGDADAAGTHLLARRFSASPVPLGRGTHVPPGAHDPDLPPRERRQRSGDGASVQHARRAHDPQEAVDRRRFPQQWN